MSSFYKVTPFGHKVGCQKMALLCDRDKSLTHRAIIFASIVCGRSKITFPLLSEDTRATINAFSKLGVRFFIDEKSDVPYIEIDSPGKENFTSPTEVIDLKNSGTSARLLIGLFSGIEGLEVTLKGDGSLSKRPMGRVVKPLLSLGAYIDSAEKGSLDYLPLTIKGRRLQGGKVKIDKASAQIKSSLLLAGLGAKGLLELELPSGARDHTELWMKSQKAAIKTEVVSSIEKINLISPVKLDPFKCQIPVDPSSAAFFAVYGLLKGCEEVELLEVLSNPTRTGYLNVLKRAGVNVRSKASQKSYIERAGSIKLISKKVFKGFIVEKHEVATLIDEVPILAVFAMFCEGESQFLGLSELRVKESDRLELIHKLINLCGGEARIVGDNLIIQGGLVKAEAFSFDPEGDHRMFMSAMIAAKMSEKESEILNPECVNVSFPNFFDLMDGIG